MFQSRLRLGKAHPKVTSSYNLDRLAITFDSPTLGRPRRPALAGDLGPTTGPGQLIDEHVNLGDAAGAPNPGQKAMTVVTLLLAGRRLNRRHRRIAHGSGGCGAMSTSCGAVD
jgi:hypothetical protein